jgi:TonB family protein
MATSPTIESKGENPAICTVHLPYNSVAVTEQTGAVMSKVPPWRQWQGQAVGKFPLKEYLGGSADSAVFATELSGAETRPAAIRLLAADAENADAQLARWAEAEKLSHPNLLRVYASGRGEVNGLALLYVVMEFAEENLAQVLPQRALTSTETREMLPPVLDALAFLHSKGYVHGGIRPANIMATGDRVKLPCDGLISIQAASCAGKPRVVTAYDAPERASGRISPPADVWSLGMTLAEVLTQRLPKLNAATGELTGAQALPEPFGEIVQCCLPPDLERRWTIAQIAARLQGKLPLAPAPKPKPVVAEKGIRQTDMPAATMPLAKRIARWPYLAAMSAGFVVLALIAGSIVWDSQSSSNQGSETAVQQTRSESSGADAAKPSPSRPANGTIRSSSQSAAPVTIPAVNEAKIHGAVLRPVYPDVPRSAQNTIHGHVRVGVRLSVDASGNVTGASLQAAGPSKYFDRLALKSAREWKFTPPVVRGHRVSSEWLLRYAFGRRDTEVHPEQKRP